MSCHPSNQPGSLETSAGTFVTAAVARERARYLSFVLRRVSDSAAAEDILQESTVRAFERATTLEDRRAFEGWFFRILRNAIIDYRRRSSADMRGREAVQRESTSFSEARERTSHTCACVMPLVDALKEEYRDALCRVEVDEVRVKEFAQEQGISPSNAGVRIHRARAALKKQVEETCGSCAAAGCGDCSCQ